MPMSNTLLYPRSTLGGVQMESLFDTTIPESFKFRGVRKLTGNGQGFNSALLPASSPLFFGGGGTSKFCGAIWLRPDWFTWVNNTFTGGANYAFKTIIGVHALGATERCAFRIVFRSPSAGSLGLCLIAGNGGGGTSIIQANQYTGVFNPTTQGNRVDVMNLLTFAFDGSAFGNDDNVFQVGFNGVKLAGVGGTTLPQQIGSPANNTAVLSIGSPYAQGGGFPTDTPVMSWADAFLSTGVPSSFTNFTTDLWNRGKGLRYGGLTANIPTPIAYFKGDDGADTKGTLPNGNCVNVANPGTYDLTPAGSPSSELMIETHTDVAKGRVAVFGWSPTTPEGTRQYEATYIPSDIDGKPSVQVNPPGQNPSLSGLQGVFAIARMPGAKASLGAYGSLLGKFRTFWSQVADNTVFGVSNDEYGLGVNKGTAGGLAIGVLAYNPFINAGTPIPCTFTAGSPGVINCTSHDLVSGDAFYVTTTGGLPVDLGTGQPLTPGVYWDAAGGSSLLFCKSPATNTLNFSKTVSGSAPGGTPGAAVNISGTGTGTHMLVPCKISQTAAKLMINLFDFYGEGNPLVYSSALGREGTIQGQELPGIPIAGNTYPQIGEAQFRSIELANVGNGKNATNFTLAPPNDSPNEIWIDNVKQTVFNDRGGVGGQGNIWAPNMGALSAIGIGALAGVTTGGAWQSGGLGGIVYRSFGICVEKTPQQRAKIRAALQTL